MVRHSGLLGGLFDVYVPLSVSVVNEFVRCFRVDRVRHVFAGVAKVIELVGGRGIRSSFVADVAFRARALAYGFAFVDVFGDEVFDVVSRLVIGGDGFDSVVGYVSGRLREVGAYVGDWVAHLVAGAVTHAFDLGGGVFGLYDALKVLSLDAVHLLGMLSD